VLIGFIGAMMRGATRKCQVSTRITNRTDRALTTLFHSSIGRTAIPMGWWLFFYETPALAHDALLMLPRLVGAVSLFTLIGALAIAGSDIYMR